MVSLARSDHHLGLYGGAIVVEKGQCLVESRSACGRFPRGLRINAIIKARIDARLWSSSVGQSDGYTLIDIGHGLGRASDVQEG